MSGRGDLIGLSLGVAGLSFGLADLAGCAGPQMHPVLSKRPPLQVATDKPLSKRAKRRLRGKAKDSSK